MNEMEAAIADTHRDSGRGKPRANRGPFPSEERALLAVVDRLVKGLRPFRIYLFGSRAEGRARPDSDFDLVVVFDDRDVDYDAAYAPLLGLGVGVDVIPCQWSEFQEVLADSTNPWQRTWASAQRLYERPAARYPTPSGKLVDPPDSEHIQKDVDELATLLQEARAYLTERESLG